MTSPRGGSLGSLFVTVEPSTRGFEPTLSRQVTKAGDKAADQAGPQMGRRLASHIGTAIAAGSGLLAAGLVKGIASSVAQARDLNETVSKSNTVFGKSAASVRQWSKNMAADFGQSQKAALDGAATFAIYGKAAGKTGNDLFNFSTDLVGLASDMASFSNTSPEDAIEAIGAAMRGEADPIEKYGVLMNDATLKATALRKGIISTTKEALTPQQRVLAVQALLFEQLGEKGSKTLGDFERTSASLSNQQRIAKASITNFSAEIGASFLPIVTRVVAKFNKEWLPALEALWRTHGPALVAWVSTAVDRFGAWVSTIDKADIARWIDNAKKSMAAAAPVIQEFVKNFQEGGKQGLSDTIKVTGEVMGFLADHVDTLGKALPYLIAGLIAYKVAQLGANVAAAAGPVLTIAEIVSRRRLTTALTQHTAALAANTATVAAGTGTVVANTVATNANGLSWGRATLAYLRSVPAMVAARAATIASTVAQWAQNAAWLAWPGTWIIAAIILVVAAIVLLWKKNETFRKIVLAVWGAIKTAIGAVKDWFLNTLWPSLKKAYEQLASAASWMWDKVRAIWNAYRDFIALIVSKVITTFTRMRDFVTKDIPRGFQIGVGLIKKWWDKVREYAAVPVRFVVETVFNKVSSVFNSIADFLHLPKNMRAPTFRAGFAAGGRLQGAPSSVDNMIARGPDGSPIGLAGGEYVVNAKQTQRHLPLLERINRGMDGYAEGGLLGFLKGPASWIKGKIGGTLDGITARAGDSFLGKILMGMGKSLVSGLVERGKSLIGGMFGGGSGAFGKWPSSPAAQRGDSGVWRSIVALIRSTGPISGAFGNGYRPGDPKWHGSGRAVDWMGYNQDALASFLAAKKPLELIHRTGSRDYAYTRGRNKGSFNNALMEAHRNHIHIAFAKGGRYRSFDQGGLWPTGTVGVNTSGRTESVVAGRTMDDAVAVLLDILAALQHLGPEVAAAVLGMVSRSSQYARMAGSPMRVTTA